MVTLIWAMDKKLVSWQGRSITLALSRRFKILQTANKRQNSTNGRSHF